MDELEKRNLNIIFYFIGGGRQFEIVEEAFKGRKIKSVFSGYKERTEHFNFLKKANMFLISQKPRNCR